MKNGEKFVLHMVNAITGLLSDLTRAQIFPHKDAVDTFHAGAYYKS